MLPELFTPAFALPFVLFLVFWALLYRPLAHLESVLKGIATRSSDRISGARLAKWAVGKPAWTGLRPYAVIVFVLTVGGIVAVTAGSVFMELAEDLSLVTSSVYESDRAVKTWLQGTRQPGLTAVLTAMTNLGGTTGMFSIVAVVAAILMIRKEHASTAFLVVTAAGGEILNLALKLIFERARPDLASAIADARWYSYPSGHAMASFIILGAISYIAMQQQWTWRVKSAVLAAAVTTVSLIGLSRVYLGVHWTSDIAGAWSAGTVWLASTIVAFEMLLRLRKRRLAGPRPIGSG